MTDKLQDAYKTIVGDHFPPMWKQVLCFPDGDVTLTYEKVGWPIVGDDGEEEIKGIRYGENPTQEAAMYKLVDGLLQLGDIEIIKPGMGLVTDAVLVQSGKHPGKINLTDADNALNMLRYFMDEAVVAILKHNNPCGVAIGDSLVDAYLKANMADRVAAFGGTIGLNQEVDKATAEAIVQNYSEVVVAPGFQDGVMEIFAKKKNLRVIEIKNMARLKEWVGQRTLDFKSLIDGGFIVQNSYVPNVKTLDDVKALKLGYHDHKEEFYEIYPTPSEAQYRDMWFGWLVESGVTSNSVLFVKDGVTVGIGTGEQDRVGVAEIAVEKAYTKARDAVCFQEQSMPYNELLEKMEEAEGSELLKLEKIKSSIEEKVQENNAGLKGSTMVSDAFFPFPDGVLVGIREGIGAIIQPGGSDKDRLSIEVCNRHGVPMVYTGLRSFKH